MAHTKAKGTSKLGRDSESKRLGVKIYGGSAIKCGQIIIRQRGTVYMPGEGVKRGHDDTLYAIRDGVVQFKEFRHTNFTGNSKLKQRVSVVEAPSEKFPPKADQPRAEKVNEKKTKAEEMTAEHLNPKEYEEVQAEKPKRDFIREVERPLMPSWKDRNKKK